MFVDEIEFVIAKAKLDVELKYSEDQPRDENGRFAETGAGGSGVSVTPKNADELLWGPGMQEIDARTAKAGYNSNYASMWREDYTGEVASTLKEYVSRDISQKMTDVPIQDLVKATGLDDDPDVAYALLPAGDYRYNGETDDEDFQIIAVDGAGNVKSENASDVLDLSMYSKDGWTKEEVLAAMQDENNAMVTETGWALQGTPEAEDMVREAGAAKLVNQWAQTSNNGHAMSLAMQEVAAKEFGIENHAPWEMNEELVALVDKYVKDDGAVYSSFLKAQYESTQEFLKDKGIDSITMFRGMKELPDEVMAEAKASANQDMSFRPLTSFSMNEATAFNFAGNHYEGITLENAVVLRSEIPAERILSIPLTGLGCLREEEAVILGGEINVDVVTAKDYFANQQANKDGWAQ